MSERLQLTELDTDNRVVELNSVFYSATVLENQDILIDGDEEHVYVSWSVIDGGENLNVVILKNPIEGNIEVSNRIAPQDSENSLMEVINKGLSEIELSF